MDVFQVVIIAVAVLAIIALICGVMLLGDGLGALSAQARGADGGHGEAVFQRHAADVDFVE